MQRRKFIKGAIAVPMLSLTSGSLFAGTADSPPRKLFSRVRPGDKGWPGDDKWNELNAAVNGNLIKLQSPLAACKQSPQSPSCNEILKELKNPYYLGDEPALTQTSGWLDAWQSAPSVYAVAAKNAADVAAAVNFARENNLRLVVKGGGHSYQGTSNCADSLLIWTRHMDNIELHDNFVAKGCEGKQPAQAAATMEAGAIWMQAYDAVVTKAGRYIQGGGCATVGVAGLIQSGGFGSFSKNYGLAAAALLEAEVVTADGKILTVNAFNHPDLFWALKGGGGGSFGVVTRLTVKTRELPEFFGAVSGILKARSPQAFHRVISYLVSFYKEHLFNPHWGEQIRFYSDDTVHINMLFQGLNKEQATAVWKPFQDWVEDRQQDFVWSSPFSIAALPARRLWDVDFLNQYASGAIAKDGRAGAAKGNIYWKGDGGEAGQFLLAYHSAWVPPDLLLKENQRKLADALFRASRYWTVSLHFNKGLAGAPETEIESAKNTAMNPAVTKAFALAIIAGNDAPAFAGMPGNEIDLGAARKKATAINQSMHELRKVIPHAGSYVSESSYFEKNWQQSYWGENYARLSAVKKQYDPNGLFFVHHGVGSEDWSDDGFTRLR
jgi:hypothetical protein